MRRTLNTYADFRSTGEIFVKTPEPPVDEIPEGLTPEIRTAFAKLAMQLCPENLNWGGYVRRTPRAVRRRRAIIMRQWRELEQRAGRKVTWGTLERERLDGWYDAKGMK